MKHLVSLTLFILLGCQFQKPEFLLEEEKNLPETIDYSTHILPILSKNCFACHGPDDKNRKAGFRLDEAQYSYQAMRHGERNGITPREPKNSEVYFRIISEAPLYMMPPPDTTLKLTNREKAFITKWIEQGAKYK